MKSEVQKEGTQCVWVPGAQLGPNRLEQLDTLLFSPGVRVLGKG